jgi:hypothetical protein
LGKHLFHFAQDPNRFDSEIRVGVAFKFGDELTLTLNAKALVNDVPFPKFDRVFGQLPLGSACIENACPIEKVREATPLLPRTRGPPGAFRREVSGH